jgi:hypothetical protein
MREIHRARRVQMIEDAGLVFGDAFAGFVLAQMPAMAGEKDGRIGI